MSKNTIITVVLIVIASGLGFFAGTRYQSSKALAAIGNRQFGNTQRTGNANQQRGLMMRGGQTVGEILNVDDTSMTVKMPDGSSKIVILSDKTTISKSTDGSKTDLKTGENVAVFGTSNSDGSLTATNIQLNPAFKMIGLTGTPAPQK